MQRYLYVHFGVPVFFQQVWLVWVLWRGGGEVKVETNSSLGDEGSHNYVQFSS